MDDSMEKIEEKLEKCSSPDGSVGRQKQTPGEVSHDSQTEAQTHMVVQQFAESIQSERSQQTYQETDRQAVCPDWGRRCRVGDTKRTIADAYRRSRPGVP